MENDKIYLKKSSDIEGYFYQKVTEEKELFESSSECFRSRKAKSRETFEEFLQKYLVDQFEYYKECNDLMFFIQKVIILD